MKKTLMLHCVILLLLSAATSFGQTNSTDNNTSKQKTAIAFPIESELEDYSILNIDVPGLLNSAKNGSYIVNVNDKSFDLELEEFSVWADDCKFYEIGDNGKIEIYPELSTSFKGKVTGDENSSVCLTVSADQSWVSGFISSGNEMFYIEPRKTVETSRHTSGEHYFYSTIDVPEFGDFCNYEGSGIEIIENLKSKSPERGAMTLNIDVHCDYEYYALNTANWFSRAQVIFVNTASIFSSAINVTFTPGEVTVATSWQDPFKTNDDDDLLNGYQDIWTRKHDTNRRQLLHVLSGKALDNGHLGLALLGGLGRSKGYSISQQLPLFLALPDNDYCRTMVTVHEIGHKFAADHKYATTEGTLNVLCGFTYYTIMYPTFWGDCTVNHFAPGNLTVMEQYADLLNVFITPKLLFSLNNDNRFTRTENIDFEIRVGNKDNPFYFIALESDLTNNNYEWRNYDGSGTGSAILPSGDGPKELIAYGFDANSNMGHKSVTIILDKTAPSAISDLNSTSHIVDVNSDDATIDICWESATDATAGVKGYSYQWLKVGSLQVEPDSVIETDHLTLCTTSPELMEGTWTFQIRAVDSAYNLGAVVSSGPYIIASITGIDDTESDMLPDEFTLEQNYPNPFNPETEIKFTLPRASVVTLEIYNVLGKRIRTLVNGQLSAGFKTISWDGCNDLGQDMSTGMYFYRLQTDQLAETKKMLLLK